MNEYVYVLSYLGYPIAAAPEDKGFERLNEQMSLYTPSQQADMAINRVKVYR